MNILPKEKKKTCITFVCVCVCLAAQKGVLPGGADGPGDLHGEADPLSGQ